MVGSGTYVSTAWFLYHVNDISYSNLGYRPYTIELTTAELNGDKLHLIGKIENTILSSISDGNGSISVSFDFTATQR